MPDANEPAANDAEALFWDCAAQLYDLPGVIEGTIFGFACLRVDEQFVGMPANESLWVKLPAERVEEVIASGVGVECRPNGRRFKEWVSVADLDEGRWLALLHESIDFVRPRRQQA